MLIGSGVEKRGLVAKVWQSKAVRQELGQGFIFDGVKLAWALKRVEREIRLIVDLDQEEGRQPRAGGKENKHRIAIRCTNAVRIDTLMSYMEGKCDMDNAVLESINFCGTIERALLKLKLLLTSCFRSSPP